MQISIKDEAVLEDWQKSLEKQYGFPYRYSKNNAVCNMMVYDLATGDDEWCEKYLSKLKETKWYDYYLNTAYSFLKKHGFHILNSKSGTEKGFIYFITDRNFVKIGFTKNVEKRLENLQVGTPQKLELTYSLEGTVFDEKIIQNMFSEYHERGEWYRLEGRLEGFLLK